MADNGDDVTMTPRLGPHDAKAILDIMVRDALDETGKNFLRLILGRMFHSLHSRDAGLNVATLAEQLVCFASPAVSANSLAASIRISVSV